MEILEAFLKPQIIGPLIGLAAVIGAFVVKGLKNHYNHIERIEKIRNGIDPDTDFEE